MDTSRRVVRIELSLSMDPARSQASQLVALEGYMKASREERTAQVKEGLNMVKGTSIVCAAVLREGHAVDC